MLYDYYLRLLTQLCAKYSWSKSLDQLIINQSRTPVNQVIKIIYSCNLTMSLVKLNNSLNISRISYYLTVILFQLIFARVTAVPVPINFINIVDVKIKRLN